MHSTPGSLLQQLRRPESSAAWAHLVDLYTPLLFHWAQQLGLQSADAADLVQDVFLILVRKLPTFEYDHNKSFRAWLKSVVANKWRERRRTRVPVAADISAAEIAAPDPTALLEDQEYQRILTHRALTLIEPEFSPILWRAFQEYALAGRDPRAVAQELHITPGTVYAVKSKVLHRLRQELQDLLE